MKRTVLLTLALFAVAAVVSAQKLSGNISPLKGQKEVNVILDFSGMLVNNQPEESHIAFFTKDKNEEEKAQWLKEWNEDLRHDAYESLTGYLNKTVNKTGLSAGDYAKAEYTIYVKVVNINVGAFLVTNSSVKADVSFMKTGETTPFATVNYNVIGRNSSYVAVPVARIVNPFGYLGDNIGKLIVKNLK